MNIYKWAIGVVYGFGLKGDNRERRGWICHINGRTWWIFKAKNPQPNCVYILTTDKHDHYSDHYTLNEAKQFAQQGGHNSVETRQKRL